MFAEFIVVCNKIPIGYLAMAFLFVVAHNGWANGNDNIKILREYENEEKYIAKNLVKNKNIALDLAEIYVKNRYGKEASEEEKPYRITDLPTNWVVEGTIESDKIAGGVFIIEINKDDGRILNFGHSK